MGGCAASLTLAAACAAGLDQRPAVVRPPAIEGNGRSAHGAVSIPRSTAPEIPILHSLAGVGGHEPVRVRNLFAFRRAPVGTDIPALTLPAPASVPPLLPPADAHQLRLIGLAEDVDGGRVVRTAFVSSATELFVVKQGDPVTADFAVLNISETQVDLLDSSREHRLVLTLGAGARIVRP